MLTCLIGYWDLFGFLASLSIVGVKGEVLTIHRLLGLRGINSPYTLAGCSGTSVGYFVRSEQEGGGEIRANTEIVCIGGWPACTCTNDLVNMEEILIINGVHGSLLTAPRRYRKTRIFSQYPHTRPEP